MWKRALFVVCLVVAGCGPSGGKGDVDGGDPPDSGAPDAPTCSNGQNRCDGSSHQTCQGGDWVTNEICADACDPGLGCVFCKPLEARCNGEYSEQCLADGSQWVSSHCDPVQGLSCDMSTGLCDGGCAPHLLERTNIGCDFYPTVTAQLVSNEFEFGVAISNASMNTANITIDGGALTSPMTFTIPPGSVTVQKLPWVPELKTCMGVGFGGCPDAGNFESRVVAGGAYRLRSNEPLAVYQFSPVDYTNGSSFSYTNDASLVLPVSALGKEYYASAYPFWPNFNYPGFVTVTAVEDNTMVTVTPKVAVGASLNFPAGMPSTVTLNQGDVLQMLNLSGDLSGSHIIADKNVQVMGGHFCTNVPQNIPYCDHLEESIFPLQVLSDEYVVTAPALAAIPNGKERVIRIIATEDNTSLSYDPPLPGAPASLALAGDVGQVERITGDFVISADKKIIVMQAMEGQDAGGGTGDPAITSAVPTAQYRQDYLFHAPTNYELNFVNVVAPTGASIMLDGNPVTGFSPIGMSGFSVARVTLTNGPAGDGNHNITGDRPFGITVYGYGQYTSFWYPGGLDVSPIE